ncbi:caspase, EACC1-associated type [Streptomyces sp. HUAS TT20]|uniref:caspase, EACC1-associated type n=1 Tax=Streptomyces sp. HUAS TT20 TaxID=3447509 RepID=UPI0021DA5612|nr:caspase family protein [Streptomyces sp. HUAS 15-9]UXY28595.1 caspase family protein [Streptomyces sp. HUAS 15-9]
MSARPVDPTRSRIVLVGTPAYDDPHLPDVKVVANNVTDLAQVFTDRDFGGFDTAHCVLAPPRASTADIGDLLFEAAAEAEDLLLFYYSGHGLLGPMRRELYLSLAGTRPDRLAFTALAFEAVRDAFLTSRATNRVVILDSCFSGRAIGQPLAGVDEEVLGQLQVKGTYTLTSAPANRTALILPGERNTAFTGRMLQLLRDGMPGAGQAIGLGDIYRHLHRQMLGAGLPVPQQCGTETADLLGLVRNRHRHKLLHVGELPDWRALKILNGHQGRILALDFSSDGKLIASGGGARDQSVRLWDTTSKRHIDTMTGHKRRVHSVKFSPDDAKIASCGDDGQLIIRDSLTRRLVKSYDCQGFPLNALAFSPDGATVAAASDDGTVRLWDLMSDAQCMVLRGHIAPVRALCFSPDARIIASTGDDSTVRIWELASGRLVQQLCEHTGKVFGVRFSPDGQTLATCGMDRTVRLWDVESGACTAALTGHADSARCVAFSPDGKVIASGGDDGTVRLWDLSSNKLVSTLHGHGGFPTRWVMWVEFHPDGDLLASCGHDRTIRLWRRVSVGEG